MTVAPATVPSLLAAAGRVRDLAAARADDAERAGLLTPDVVGEIRRAGLPGLGLPTALGGHAAPPGDTIRVIETIAAGDAAAAWVVMIAATSSVYGAHLSPEAAGEVFANGASSILAGVFAPKGRATRVEGGHRVTGRWPFGSAGGHADWMSGGVLLADDGSPYTAFFPRTDVTFHDTWHVTGLTATGSNDFSVEDRFVPDRFLTSLELGRPWSDEPLYRFPIFGLLAVGVASVTLGIARGAIDDLVGLATEKVPTGSRRLLAERPAVQEAVARSEASLDAARRSLLGITAELWAAACDGREFADLDRARLRMAASHATATAAGVVDAMHEVAGGSSIYRTSPLERRFRDVHTATQHMMVARPTWEVAGRVLLGVSEGHRQL